MVKHTKSDATTHYVIETNKHNYIHMYVNMYTLFYNNNYDLIIN